MEPKNQSRLPVVSARLRAIILCVAALQASACGGGSDKGNGGSGGGGSSSPGTPIQLGSTTVVGVDGSSVNTALPSLPGLTNVLGTLREDSVGISFDPVDGATDYRVYPLPDDGDITAYSDGTLTVKNAIYRCAGMRQTFDLQNNLNASDSALTPASKYGTTAKIDADASKNTLGYVYMTAGDGRIPVYAVAGYPMDLEVGWRESRYKLYTTSDDERKMYLDQGWRDDGIVFYVPAAASGDTHTVYGSQVAAPVLGQNRTAYSAYYFNADGMSAHASDSTPPAAAFEVLTAATDDAKPLMATFYSGAQSHVELSPGPERFKRAAYQGSLPDWHVEWSGLSGKTTLVIEALKNGCPFQGFLSPQHLDAPPHQTFYTLSDLQQASPTGEVFINGQYDNVAGKPQPLARSFLTVTPMPHDPTAWDWYEGFSADSTFGPPVEVPGCTDLNCGRWQTSDLDITSYRIDEPSNVPVVAFGTFMGQLWDAFDDYGQDVTGKMRFTALTKANIDSDPNKYLHATMSVDIVSTDRRYPQMIISDQDAPVQESFKNPNNNTVLIQPILGPSTRIEVEAFHGLVPGLIGFWDVNNQAPEHRFIDYDTATVSAQPNDSPLEHSSMDRLTKFDVFLSSARLYVFMDGEPAGCTLLPSDVKLGGPVTYTVGDVLYHEGAPDELVCAQTRPYSFMHAHQCNETKRHFDDLAFKSGTPPPAWDDKKFPCLPY